MIELLALIPSAFIKCAILFFRFISRLYSQSCNNEINRNVFVDFFFVCTSHSRMFYSYGDVTITEEGLQILTFAQHSWPLSSQGSLAGHTYCNIHIHRSAFSIGAVTTIIFQTAWHFASASGLKFSHDDHILRYWADNTWSTDRPTYRPTVAKQYAPFFKGGIKSIFFDSNSKNKTVRNQQKNIHLDHKLKYKFVYRLKIIRNDGYSVRFPLMYRRNGTLWERNESLCEWRKRF